MFEGNGQVVVYVLFSLVLILIVAYIVWKATKNKRIKRKELKEQNKRNNETLNLFYEFILSFYTVIKFTKNELNKFNSKTTDHKMGEIKNGAKRMLIKLIQNDDFAIAFHDNEQYKEFVENAEILTTTQPNLWDKKIPKVLEFFEFQYNKIPSEKFNSKLEKLTLESLERKFYEE